MFLANGVRAWHEGRQKIPVLLTAIKNTPSYELSRAVRARSISRFDNESIDCIPFFVLSSNSDGTKIAFRPFVLHRKFDMNILISDCFLHEFHLGASNRINERFGETACKAIMDRIVFEHSFAGKFVRRTVPVTQIGEPFFDFHSITGGFNDEFSIRTDQPDYTNISGGFGLFAAFVLENFHRRYPADFYHNPEGE